MPAILDKIFLAWLFSIPFSWVIASYTGTLAPDKVVAPALLLAGLTFTHRSSAVRLMRIGTYTGFATIFLLVKHISFIDSDEVFFSLLWTDGIRLGYFLIPILFITDISRFRRASWVVVGMAVVGCISVILVSTGLMTLPLERFEGSRIGIEGLQKAIGFFPSYGDLAQYISYALLWVVVSKDIYGQHRNIIQISRGIVFISALAGLAGAQSRNMLLSMIVSLFALYLLRRINKSRLDKTAVYISLGAAAIMGISLLASFSAAIVDMLSGMGGDYARNTANARLGQYSFGWDVITRSPLFGATLDDYLTSGFLIDHIHNMWIRLAAHGGLLTVFAFLAFLSFSFLAVRARAAEKALANEVMVVTGYFCALALSTMFYGGMAEIFWALFGVATAISCLDLSNGRVGQASESGPSTSMVNNNSKILAPRSRKPFSNS